MQKIITIYIPRKEQRKEERERERENVCWNEMLKEHWEKIRPINLIAWKL